MSVCIVFDFFRSKCSGKNVRKFLFFKQCIPTSTISGKCSQCIPPEITKKPKVFSFVRGYKLGKLARNDLRTEVFST